MPYVALSPGCWSDTYQKRGQYSIPHPEEAIFNAKIGECLRELLEYNDIHVLVVRPYDQNRSVTLTERMELAEQKGVDLFLGIHGNTGPKSAHGACIFYNPGVEAERLSKIWKANWETRFGSYHLHGKGSYPYPQGTKPNASRSTPSVFVKHGFITNPGDLQLMYLPEYLRECALVCGKSIGEYFRLDFGNPRFLTGEKVI